MPVKEVSFDGVVENAVALSADEKQAIAKKMAALRELLANKEVKAKYKLEVQFARARHTWKPTPGLMTFWLSGSKLHGGGDEKLYLCPGRRMGRNSCEQPIPELANSMATLVCPSCGNIWKAEQVIGELGFNLSMRKWAEVLYAHFIKFENNCDLVLKHSPDDLRSIALQQASFKRWEKLDRTRAKRARHVYPLAHIIKDTSAGSDLLTRIYAFLVA